MQLSKTTLDILKSFAGINGSILLKPGNTISTISVAKTVLATATVEETFPIEFGIYDLSRFLNFVSLIGEDASLKFNEKEVIIKGSSGNSARVVASLPTLIVAPPDKKINMPDVAVEIDLSAATFESILKGAGVAGVPNIRFVGEKGKLFVEAINAASDTSDAYRIAIGSTDETFVASFKTDNLKLIKSDYKVEITKKNIARFTAPNIVYFIAIEASDSSFS